MHLVRLDGQRRLARTSSRPQYFGFSTLANSAYRCLISVRTLRSASSGRDARASKRVSRTASVSRIGCMAAFLVTSPTPECRVADHRLQHPYCRAKVVHELSVRLRISTPLDDHAALQLSRHGDTASAHVDGGNSCLRSALADRAPASSALATTCWANSRMPPLRMRCANGVTRSGTGAADLGTAFVGCQGSGLLRPQSLWPPPPDGKRFGSSPCIRRWTAIGGSRPPCSSSRAGNSGVLRIPCPPFPASDRSRGGEAVSGSAVIGCCVGVDDVRRVASFDEPGTDVRSPRHTGITTTGSGQPHMAAVAT